MLTRPGLHFEKGDVAALRRLVISRVGLETLAGKSRQGMIGMKAWTEIVAGKMKRTEMLENSTETEATDLMAGCPWEMKKIRYQDGHPSPDLGI